MEASVSALLQPCTCVSLDVQHPASVARRLPVVRHCSGVTRRRCGQVQADQLCCGSHHQALLRLQMTHTFTSTHQDQQQTREAETVTAAVTVYTDKQPSHAVGIFWRACGYQSKNDADRPSLYVACVCQPTKRAPFANCCSGCGTCAHSSGVGGGPVIAIMLAAASEPHTLHTTWPAYNMHTTTHSSAQQQ